MKPIDLVKNISPITAAATFKKELEEIEEKGFIIIFAGLRVKPIQGKVSVYPSKNAAMDALKRNCNMYWNVLDIIGIARIGISHKNSRKKFIAHFFNFGEYRSPELRDEYALIEDAATLATPHFIRTWLKSGLLEIKEI